MKHFLISLSASFLLFTGCNTAETQNELPATETSDESTTSTTNTETVSTETHASVFDFPPENAKDVQAKLLYLDDDEYPEELLTYRVDNVPVYHQTDTVYYLLVLRLEKEGWTVIKEDQRGETTGIASEGKFCQAEVVNFHNSPDYLLVSKCTLQGKREGYYVFGEIPGKPGTFGDLQIGKAYLNDPDIELTNVRATEWGLVEEYTVTESAQAERHCKNLSVKQSYNPQIDNEGFSLSLDSNGESYDYTECTVWPSNLLENIDPETIKVGDKIGEWTVSSNSYAESENHEGSIEFSGQIQITGSFSDEQFKDWPELGLVCMDTLTDESTLRAPSASFCFTNPEEALAAIEGKEKEVDVTFIIKDFVLDLRGMETNNMTTFVSLVE